MLRRRMLQRRLALAAPLVMLAWPLHAGADVTSSWLSAVNGAWASTSKWSSGTDYPENNRPSGTGYDAVIDAVGTTDYTITYTSSLAVNSLDIDSSDAILNQTSGSFTPDNVNLQAGTYELTAGELANSTITLSGGTFSTSGGTLLNMSFTGSPGAVMLFNPATAISGTFSVSAATIQLQSGSLAVTNGTLNGVTVTGGDLAVNANGSLDIQGGLTISDQNLDLGTNASVYFDGTSQTINNLNITSNSGTIYLDGPSSAGAQTLTLGSNVTVNGGVQFDNSNFGDSLVNNGTLSAASSANLTLAVKTSSFINNGTVEAANGLTVSVSNQQPVGTAFTNNGTLSANDAVLDIEQSSSGTWTNAGTITATNASEVNLGGNFTTGGLGTFIASADTNIFIQGSLDNTNATFSPQAYGGAWYLQGGTITNGTLDVSSGSFNVESGTFDNVTVVGGDLQVTGGATLNVVNGLTIADQNLDVGTNSTVNFRGPSQTLNLNIGVTNGTLGLYGTWTNAGTINASNSSAVLLGGTFTTAGIGTFTATSDTYVWISGSLDNSNATLNTGNYGGVWNLGGPTFGATGTITNGTIDTSGDNFYVDYGTLDNVTIIGGDLRTDVYGTLTIPHALTVADHNVDLGSGTNFIFDGPGHSIDNLNIFASGNYPPATIYPSGPDSNGPQTLTLGANVTVHGSAQFENFNIGDCLVNNGTIDADSPINFSPPTVIGVSSFTNNGTLLANDGELDIVADPWTNVGTISATNGSVVNLGGNFKTADIGTFSASADTSVKIIGTLNNSSTTFNAAPYGGNWILGNNNTLQIGTISNGTVDVSGGNFSIFQGVLNGVTVVGGDLQVQQGGQLFVQNGLTVSNHNLQLATSANVYFDAQSQTIDNVNIVPSGNNQIYADGPDSTGQQTLTLGANVTVHGGVQITYNNFFEDTLINNGNINADNASNIVIGVPIFTNNGIAQATGGGELYISSIASFTNNGTFAVHNGTIDCPIGLAVGDGTLVGSGTIEGGITLDSDPSTLAFSIGGETQGTDYDFMQVFDGSVTLAGNLQITLTHGFVPLPGDTFTVLMVDPDDTLGGTFANVADDGRLETTDLGGSFLVDYGPDTNEIVLSDFVQTPEPASLALLAASACGLLTRRRRA